MEKDVIISIHSIQDLSSDEPQVIDFMTLGKYRKDGEVARLSYDETDVTGMAGTRTGISFFPGEIIVDRVGTVSGIMTFRPGLTDNMAYRTEYGQTNIGIDTRARREDFNENSGKEEKDNVVNIDHMSVGRNRFELTVREDKKEN